MTPRELVAKAEDLGVRLIADGTILRCKCSRGFPDQLRTELLNNKTVLLAYLDGLTVGMSGHIRSPGELPSEWHVVFEERAALMVYDGNMPREQAEHIAFQETLKQLRREQQSNVHFKNRLDRTTGQC